MKTLNLNNLEQSDVKYKYFLLPDGQPHIKIPEPCSVSSVVCSITSMNDYGKLLITLDALARIPDGFYNGWELKVLYMLGARQDRYVEGEAVTAEVLVGTLVEFLKGLGCS